MRTRNRVGLVKSGQAPLSTPLSSRPAAPWTVNRALEAKARELAGLKGCVTNLTACPEATPVTARIRHRCLPPAGPRSKVDSDAQTRPASPTDLSPHHRDSIEAHLAIVFAALAVSRWIEDSTGWSIKKFVRTVRRYPHHRNPSRRPHPSPQPTPSYPTTAATPRSHHPSQPTCELI